MTCHSTFFDAPEPPNSCGQCGGCGGCGCAKTHSQHTYTPELTSCCPNAPVGFLEARSHPLLSDVFACLSDEDLAGLLEKSACYRLRCICDPIESIVLAAAHTLMMKSIMSAEHSGRLASLTKGKQPTRYSRQKGASHWELTPYGLMYLELKESVRMPAMAGMA